MERHTKIGTCVEKMELRNHVGITGIVGGPSCGKSTLLKVLQKASCFLQGLLFCDMSEDIIKWHEDPQNHSPLRDAFLGSEESRHKGNLLNDVIIDAAITDYIRHHQEFRLDHGIATVHHVFIGGWPRTHVQLEKMQEIDPGGRIAHINISEARADENRLDRINRGIIREDDEPHVFTRRWEKYRTVTEPEIRAFGSAKSTRYITIKFTWDLTKKAKILMRRLNVMPEERASMIKRIHEPDSDAARFIHSIVTPLQVVEAQLPTTHPNMQAPAYT